MSKAIGLKRVLVSHLDLQHGRNFLAKSRKALEIFQLVKGVVIFFSTSIISCLEKHAIKNPMLYTSLSSHLSLLEKLGLDDDIIFNTSLGTTFPRAKEKKSCLEFLHSPEAAPHFALSEEATIQLNIPHCVVRLQGSASE